MRQLKVVFWIALLLHQGWLNSFVKAAPQNIQPPMSGGGRRDIQSSTADSALGSMYRKNRQLRCVRCYDDRYGDDRGRNYGGYSSRSTDDRSNWYYPSNDRYDDRYRPADYDRYYSSHNRDRGERDGSRSYDRYEGRGYDRYDRRGSYDQDRYSDYNRDRYERPRGYDRDNYDRYSSRYDNRNYRPWDETYRGQSGFDNSGRGYYFASENNRDRYPSADTQRHSPCGAQVTQCRYEPSTQVTSRPINSRGQSENGVDVTNKNGNGDTIGDAGTGSNSSRSGSGWMYINERDKNARGDRERNRDQQSPSYGGRPARPLSGSYLFDRDTNATPENKATTNSSDRNDGTATLNAQNDSNPPENTATQTRPGDKQQ